MFLAETPRSRDAVLAELRIGLRTFYRELELLKKCGVKIQQKERSYRLMGTAEEAEGKLPFPDPQLSFAEMSELSRCSGEAAARLKMLLASVTTHQVSTPKRGSGSGGEKTGTSSRKRKG